MTCDQAPGENPGRMGGTPGRPARFFAIPEEFGAWLVAASVKFLVLGAATTAARTHSSSETKGTGHGVAHDDGVDRASLDLALESVIAGLETEYAAVQVD